MLARDRKRDGRNAYLHSTISHLQETRSSTKDGTGSNHLVDALTSCTDDSTDEQQRCAREEEVATTEDIRETATSGNEDGTAQVPGDGDPCESWVGTQIGVDVGQDGRRTKKREDIGVVAESHGLDSVAIRF